MYDMFRVQPLSTQTSPQLFACTGSSMSRHIEVRGMPLVSKRRERVVKHRDYLQIPSGKVLLMSPTCQMIDVV